LTDNTLYIYLNDKMVDLDKPVTVFLNGKKVYKRIVARKLSNLMQSTAERGDPNFVFPGKITLKIK
ncbi:MAG: alpha/beta hydrolase, partial [Lentisphaeria bacterium]|nr:alpha/beta hydrolase [Lentisphaeria bacterium]